MKSTKWLLSVMGVFLLVFGASPALAFDYFDASPEDLLSAEIISISKKPQTTLQTPAAVYVITKEDILRSGVTTIPDALRMAPGVQVAQVDSNSYAVSIRGFNSPLANKILVMMDGRTVYNPLFAGTYWEAQDIVLSDVDRIEIIRGPGGALWGANAVNGVINIITRPARATQGNVVSLTAGNYEHGTLSARNGGRLGENGHYRVYARAFSRDHYSTPGGGNAYDDWNSKKAGFRADWNNESLTIQGDIYQTNTRQTARLATFAGPFFEIRRQHLSYEGGNILARTKHFNDQGGLTTLQTYLDFTRRNEPGLLDDRRAILDFDAQHNFSPSGRHEVILGGNYRFTGEKEKGTAIFNISPANDIHHLVGLFIQDRIMLVPDTWYLTLGTKVEHNHYSGIEHQPNIRLEWLPDEAQTFWASVSRAVRTPSRLERDVTFITNNTGANITTLISNDNFDSEELIAYEAGYRRQITPDLTVDIALFVNDYDKLPSYTLPAAPAGQTYLQFENGATAETYGAEITSSWRARDNLTLSGTYSVIDIQKHAAELSAFNEYFDEGQTPHQQASLRAFWSINSDWSVNTAAYYTGAMKADNVDSYVRLDVNLGWRITDNVQFNLIGQNLLDDAHREFGDDAALNAAEVNRSVFGKITWNF